MATSEVEPTAAERSQAAYEKAYARIKGDGAADDDAADVSPLSEALTAEGIEHTTTPKPEAVEVPEEEAAAEPEGDDGMDALVAALDPRAEGAQRRAQETATIEEEARELGFSEAMVKHLAHNTPRKNAREILASERERLQSAPAVQSAQAATPAVEVAPPAPVPSPAPAEVMEALRDSLGDEAAQAVADGVLSPLLARIAQLEQGQQAVAQTFQEARASEMRSQVLTAAGELSGEFPDLVRGERIDPAVAGLAADLLQGSTYGGNVKGALEAAARLTYGSVPSPRQAPPAAKGTDTSAPPVLAGVHPTQRIGGHEIAEAIADVGRKFKNDPDRLRAESAKVIARVKRHNAQVPKG